MITGVCDDFPASWDSEASKEIQSSQKLDVDDTPSLKLFRCWNDRWKEPRGTFVAWEKNNKHSQDDTWGCLCSRMLISPQWWLMGHNWQLEQLWVGERGLATQPETKQLGLHYPQGMCEQICWSGEFFCCLFFIFCRLCLFILLY